MLSINDLEQKIKNQSVFCIEPGTAASQQGHGGNAATLYHLKLVSSGSILVEHWSPCEHLEEAMCCTDTCSKVPFSRLHSVPYSVVLRHEGCSHPIST